MTCTSSHRWAGRLHRLAGWLVRPAPKAHGERIHPPRAGARAGGSRRARLKHHERDVSAPVVARSRRQVGYDLGTLLDCVVNVSNTALEKGHNTGMLKLTIITSLIQAAPILMIFWSYKVTSSWRHLVSSWCHCPRGRVVGGLFCDTGRWREEQTGLVPCGLLANNHSRIERTVATRSSTDGASCMCVAV